MTFLVARHLAPLVMAGVCLAADTGDGLAAEPVRSAYETESAMIHNFTKFIEWPQSALGAPGAPVFVGVRGDDLLLPVLAAALRDKTIYGHPIVVRRFDADSELKSCAVLVVGIANRRELRRIMQSIGRAPVLTVGEGAQFTQSGGVIALIREGTRIRFEINPDAADRAHLTVSSKLLRLAKVWREADVSPRF